MRYDFDDQFQVRYTHPNGDHFDTWVSGEEALRRLKSEESEERIRALRNLDLQELKRVARDIPQEGKTRTWRYLKNRLADSVEEAAGDNVISETLADAVRGEENDVDSQETTRNQWLALLDDLSFREKLLELAWIQLEGSFPPEASSEAPDGWV